MVIAFWKHGSNAALGVLIVAVAVMDSFAWRVHLWLVVQGAGLFFVSEYGFHRYAFHALPGRGMIAHIPYRPRTRWGRWVKKYHLWHHFKNEHLWFGVTNPSFDFAMRSYQPVDEAAPSRTARTLNK